MFNGWGVLQSLSEPVFTTGVVSVSEHSTTNKLLTIVPSYPHLFDDFLGAELLQC